VSQLRYDNPFGSPVRIGVLQKQQSVQLSLPGKYAVRTAKGPLDPVSGIANIEFRAVDGSAAALRWRLVMSKSTTVSSAAGDTPTAPELEPLETISLGFDFGTKDRPASAVEHWRCSRSFASREEAEAARGRLAQPERISILEEVAIPSSGSVRVTAPSGFPEVGAWIRFEPLTPESARAIIHDVIVGVGFHWQHFERQKFRGVIEVRIDNAGLLTVINEVPAEAYLFSVNSSEMMSVMPEELLKAQTVAARNTLFATMGKHHYADAFHLCADDHCQCYRGSSRETADSRRVTLATAGEVLVHDGAICDARYSKMCGGIIEAFDSVWNEDPRAYLPAGVDAPGDSTARKLIPANTDERAAALIDSLPDVWCNTTGDDVPPYLQYSAPYFRWQMRYTRTEAEELLSRHVGANIGELRELIPLSRGASGRIELLKVVASNGEWRIGKELQIRKALSRTCLYSSCFRVEYEREPDGRVAAIVLIGGGWGHGAGMCQVGATMMAYRGKKYREMLTHYYPKTVLLSLGVAVGSQEESSVIAAKESRLGERCYEFYNCYAVARCPVYLEKVELEACAGAGAGSVTFSQPAGSSPRQLDKMGIQCEFLTIKGDRAEPKG
jgi:stage II sporulation protein D